MGRRVKQKKFIFEEDDDELQGVKSAASKSAKSLSSDEDEANEDLSLKIVEKAIQLRSGKLVTDASVKKDGNSGQSGKGDIAGVGASGLFSSSSEDANPDAGTSGPGADGIAAASVGRELGSKKTVKKRKKKVKKLGAEERDVVVTEGEKVETTVMIDQVDSVEPKSTETTDNIVFRKLLRGPRYFDPSDSLGTCYNCGEEGHNAVNCTSAKRKRPCFVCGSLEHNAKSCSKARDCFICKKGGHRANNCPEKHRNVSSSLKICLKCGDSGHDMFSCQKLYSDDDLKNIQCYICKKFGHLCCVNSTSDTSVVSCYKCGQTGHTGLSCSRLRGEASGAVSTSQCYRCGEEGHFARECTSSTKGGKRNREDASGAASPSPCYRCGEEGHFARECTSSTKGGMRFLEETSGAASPSSCYRCGEQGHFAHGCTSLTKGGKRIIEETSVPLPASHGFCYKCGEQGHFARECISSTKGGKRNRELSIPRLKSQLEAINHMGSKSVPHDKKKKINHEEEYYNLPRKSGQKGHWIPEDTDSGNFSNGTFIRNDWNSPGPVTPSRWGHNHYAEYSGQHTNPQFSGHYASPQFSGRYANSHSSCHYANSHSSDRYAGPHSSDRYAGPHSSGHYANSHSSDHYAGPQSFTKRHTLHPGTPMSFGTMRTPQNGYSESRFGGYSNEGRRKNYAWW